jgi:EmrB/QacA subfamily drug resistance transporter
MQLSSARWPALVLLCAATLMIILDGTIVTIALPSIQRSLHFSATTLTWVVDAYMISFGSLLLLAGRVGDLAGRKGTLLAGLTLFTAASLLCGLATSPAMLIAARFAQGAGGAMVSAVALGMIAALYPEPEERTRALAVFSFTGAAGAALGLIAGGVLTQLLDWHWIFFVNLPIGVLTGAAAWRVLESDRGIGLRAGADLPGALLVTSGLVLAIYAIVADPWFAIGAAVLLAGFFARQARAAVPLLDLRILASRNVSGVYVIQLLVIAAAWSFQILTTLYMQDVLGYGPAASGLAFTPTAVVIAVVSLGLAARLIARFGARSVLLAGLALIAAALIMLVGLPVRDGFWDLQLPALLIFGVGGGLTLPALATLGMADATPADAGLVSGLFNTGQQLGGALGVAALSALAAVHTRELTAAGRSAGAALTGGYHLAFGVGAALSIVGIVLSAAILRGPRRPVPSDERREPEGECEREDEREHERECATMAAG